MSPLKTANEKKLFLKFYHFLQNTYFGDFYFLKFQYLSRKVADYPKNVAGYVKCPKYLPKTILVPLEQKLM
jgi:hypothetical protein